MSFVPNTKTVIAGFTFYTLHDLRVDKTIYTYTNTGMLKIPARARIRKRSDNNFLEFVETANQFKEGDPVEIYAGYDGILKKEFAGFVRRVNKTIPCQIELEGYSYELRTKTNVNKFWKSATVKEIMQEAIKGTSIKLMVQDDLPVVNFIARNANGAQVLDNLIEKVSDRALTARFITDDTLWIGLRYTAYKSTVKYKLGYNVIKDDELKERIADKTKIQINYVHKKASGERVRAKATNGVGQVKKKTLAAVESEEWLKKLTDTKLSKEAYDGFEGNITTFLFPYAEPGDMALLSDPFFNRNGGFIIDKTTLTLNRSGGRRIVGIGVKVQ